MIRLAALVSLFCLSFTTLAASPECPIGRAIYTLQADKSFTAGAETLGKGEPVFFVRSERSQKTYWFDMELGNGRSDTHLFPITPPTDDQRERKLTRRASTLPTMSIFELSRDLVVTSLPLGQMEYAPPYIFVPELGSNLWYFSNAFSNDDATVREILPRSLFVLSSCNTASR